MTAISAEYNHLRANVHHTHLSSLILCPSIHSTVQVRSLQPFLGVVLLLPFVFDDIQPRGRATSLHDGLHIESLLLARRFRLDAH